MKILTPTLLALALFSAVVPAHADQEVDAPYRGQITFNSRSARKHRDSLRVNILANLEDVRLPSRTAVTLRPVIVSADGSQRLALEPVVLGGRNRVIMAKRGQFKAAGVTDQTSVIHYRKGTPSSIDLSRVVPYYSWMKTASLQVEEYATGCANCPEGERVHTLRDHLMIPEHIPALQLAYLTPAHEETKLREDKFTARFTFRVNRYELLPMLGNNSREFERVDSVTRAVFGNRDIRVHGVSVDGYASPEGYYTANIELSRNRARAFVSYLKTKYKLGTQQFVVSGHGEDWQGLIDYVSRSTMPEKQQVLDLLSRFPDSEDRKRELRLFNNGSTYAFLLENYYPWLRRTEYRFRYEVRPYTLMEARERIKTNPRLLSLEEMFQVANSYPVGSDERRYAVEVATRYFGEDPTARLNAVVNRLENFPTTVEASMFEALPVSPEWNNAIGVFFAHRGELEQALQYFEKAGALPAAKHNAAELRKLLSED